MVLTLVKKKKKDGKEQPCVIRNDLRAQKTEKKTDTKYTNVQTCWCIDTENYSSINKITEDLTFREYLCLVGEYS